MQPESVERIHSLTDRILLAQQSRNRYWATLNKLRGEYFKTITGPIDLANFYSWVTSTWGIRVVFDTQGNITADYIVVDEKLYLMYILKWGR